MSGSNKVIKVRLELHGQNLKNVAGFGHGMSDPFAIVTLISNQPNVKPILLGRTEVYVLFLSFLNLCYKPKIMILPLSTPYTYKELKIH